MAGNNLDKVFFEVLEKKIKYIITQGIWLLPQIIDTWNWYVSKNRK
jgi:HD superfamily phosphohydrolase YqeK